MVVTSIQPAKEGVRKRKTHRKSRQGCANCKLRRVKCDEEKPKCQKCIDYGVDCSYDANNEGNLQLAAAGAFMIEVPQVNILKPPSADKANLAMIDGSLSQGYANIALQPYRMTHEDLKTLKRFQTRTVRTIGTADTYHIYQDEMVRLASCNPFLMHIMLTLTLQHDRYIANESKLSVSEAYHWYQGTALFHDLIKRPIKPQERDAVWASAALLGAVAFSALEVASPEEAWPLKAPSSTDLDWLFMSDGKKEIARLAYPEGPSSVFYEATCTSYINLLDQIPKLESDFASYPDGFIEVYELQSPCNAMNNPYHKAAAMLNVLLLWECNYTTVLHYFSFIGHMPSEFKQQLAQKDARALLLLAYWQFASI